MDSIKKIIEDTLLFAQNLKKEEDTNTAIDLTVRLAKVVGYDFPVMTIWCPSDLMAEFGLSFMEGP